jgi:transcriptional regulator GlxA family with amidase domain
MNDTSSRAKIAILAFSETTAAAVYGMHDLFMSAGRDWQWIVHGTEAPSLLHPRVVSRFADPFAAANGVHITAHETLDQCGDAQVICVPHLLVAPEESLEGRFDAEIEWLKESYTRGATVASACTAALLLAEAGLLDGCEAATHWAYCDTISRRYPSVTVRPQRTLVISGEGQRVVTAGGGASWVDLALYVIARLAGVEAAMQLARVNLIDWHHVGQQPFAHLARSRQVDDAVVARCQTWIAEHYHEPAPVAALVRLSGLPERSFKRRFRQATGMSPLEYVHTLRLEEAKQMLESGDQPIEVIANAVGYEDAGFFGRLFRRHVTLTPAQYRKRFGGLRRKLQGAGALEDFASRPAGMQTGDRKAASHRSDGRPLTRNYY